MRFVTWNRNGAFRKKWEHLARLDPTIAVIQECEDPSLARDAAYQTWAGSYLWDGPNKNKGIGVFAAGGVKLTPIPLDTEPLEMFLPCLVDGEWPLLAVWTRRANSPNFGYVGQLWKFLQTHREFLMHPGGLVIGDLNSNTRWDEWDRWWNHSDVVKELADLGLTSCYHRNFQEVQGAETRSTFYLQRNRLKPYHIDYAFAGPAWAVKYVDVGDADTWLAISDHMPLVIDLEMVQHELTPTIHTSAELKTVDPMPK